MVANIGPLGCVPSQLSTQSEDGECIASLNQYAMAFNNALKPMLASLRTELPDALILVSDSFNMAMDVINNAAAYGEFCLLSFRSMYTLGGGSEGWKGG